VAGKAFALLGPTASGKSHLAIEIAERAPVEIVSMDSAQVYRGLDIGTAKPSAEERRRVPHHLVDLLDADRSYSTGRWRADAIAAIRQILAKGRVPLIVGGTMLYYRALVGGLDVLPQADPAVRAEIDADAAARGWPALHAELERVDPKSARRISPGDTQRIQRALEVWRLTGKPLSALQGVTRAELPFALKAFALVPAERELLHERIARRFDAMLKAGLVDELEQLRSRYRLTPGRCGNTSTAKSTRRRCASRRSPRRASSPSASSRGCAASARSNASPMMRARSRCGWATRSCRRRGC